MKKVRRLLALLMAVSIAVVSAGCSKEITAEDLMVNIEENNASELDLDDAFCEKYSVAAFKMLKNEYSDDSAKIVLSPLAAYYNSFMLMNGATGQTKEKLENLFGRRYFSQNMNPIMHSIYRNLKDTDKSKLYFENALWFNSDKNIAPASEFLSVAKNYYNADAYKESFSKDAVTNINNWASNKTNMYSERIIKEIPKDAPFYMVNTTLLEADWEAPIRSADIFDGKFKSLSGDEQDVQMMSSYEKTYIGNESVVGFMKSYAGGNYAFLALLPVNESRSSLTELVDYLSRERVYRELIKGRKDWRVVDASIPKFSCSYTGEINSLIEKAELGQIFSSENAGFDNVGTCDGKIYLGGIAVSTGLTVTESGTKKGTGANVGNTDAGVDMIPINLNRPFVFAVVETKRYLPVMVGAVNSVK